MFPPFLLENRKTEKIVSDLTLKISPNIVLGTYAVSRLGQFVKDYGEKFMLILDPLLKETGISEKITQSLADRNIEYFTFSQITDNSSKTVEAALALAQQSHVHAIIAVGGGKAISIGRAVSALINFEKDIYSVFEENITLKKKNLPLICFPTTIRDPFIFTGNIPVVDSRNSRQKILKCNPNLCDLAIFDPNLIQSLTDNQRSSMSLEIMCLLIESYVSPKATFFSDMIVEKATEILGYALDGSESLTVTAPKEVLLSQSGSLASLASGISSLGAASLIALTINGRFRISRSLVSAILLPYIIDDCAKFKNDRILKLASLLKLIKEDESPEQAAANLAENMRSRLAKENLPTRLKDLSIPIEKLALACEDAGELDLINSLPRSMTSDDLFDLIKQAY